MAVSFVIWRVFDHPLNRWRAAWVKSRMLPDFARRDEAQAARAPSAP